MTDISVPQTPQYPFVKGYSLQQLSNSCTGEPRTRHGTWCNVERNDHLPQPAGCKDTLLAHVHLVGQHLQVLPCKVSFQLVVDPLLPHGVTLPLVQNHPHHSLFIEPTFLRKDLMEDCLVLLKSKQTISTICLPIPSQNIIRLVKHDFTHVNLC